MKNANLLEQEERPAPGDLRFVQGLLNTLDLSKGVDQLGDPVAAGAWLQRFGLVRPGRTIDAEDAARLRRFREAIRALLSHDEDDGAEDGGDEIGALNDLTADVALGVTFGPGGAVMVQNRSDGIAGALGTLLVAITAAAAQGTWQRLKVCSRDSCRWAFYDASKNRSSNWCSMEVCGNREKVARHRHKATAGARSA